jgi:hypothetical protein
MSAESEAEQFIRAAVDQAPEPLRRLGRFLADVLDEDHFKTADRMMLAVAAYGADGRPVRDALSRCEMWFSVHPEGREMRDVCRAALSSEEAQRRAP